MTGADVARAVVAKGNYAASADWSIFEAVQDGALERPIGDRESVLQATMAWTGRGVLRLRSFAAKELLGKALEAPTKGWLQLRMNGNAVALSNKPCRSVVKDRKWKRFWCTCDLNVSGGDPPALFYFKDEYQSGEVGHIMLRSLAVYTVTAAAGSAFPSTLGVRVSGVSGVPGDDQWFYLAVENEVSARDALPSSRPRLPSATRLPLLRGDSPFAAPTLATPPHLHRFPNSRHIASRVPSAPRSPLGRPGHSRAGRVGAVAGVHHSGGQLRVASCSRLPNTHSQHPATMRGDAWVCPARSQPFFWPGHDHISSVCATVLFACPSVRVNQAIPCRRQ